MTESSANLYARIRKLEADRDKQADQIKRLERVVASLLPPPQYDGHLPDPRPIWPVKEPNA